MNNSCNVMQDLFVPYLDETCSDESRALLEQHLKECKSCRMALETYQSPIPSVDVKENVQAEKPFKKIRRKIRFFIVAIVVLLILILPVAVYQIYGHTHNFYKADRVFLGLDDDDFFNASKMNRLEERACSMYRTMYYTLQSRNGTAKTNATLSELVDESNALDQVMCDYENAEIVYNEEFNTITVIIPLILPHDDVPTVFQLTGSRVGCGRYSFTEFMLYPKNLFEENYMALNYANVIFDSLDSWPFVGYMNWMVESWKKYDLPDNVANEPKNYSDTGMKIPSGVYVYTQDDGKEATFIVYDDGTLMYELSREEVDNSDFPYMYPAMIDYTYHTAKPRPYFIVEGDDGFDLIIRYEKTGIRNTHTIEFLEDGSLRWRNRIFVKTDDTPHVEQ